MLLRRRKSRRKKTKVFGQLKLKVSYKSVKESDTIPKSKLAKKNLYLTHLTTLIAKILSEFKELTSSQIRLNNKMKSSRRKMFSFL